MDCTCPPIFKKALVPQLAARFPGRDISSDGCCGDAAHQARKSKHNAATSGPAKGYARAYDVDEDLVQGLGIHQLATWSLTLIRFEPVNTLIYEGQIFYTNCNVHGKYNCTGHPYHGINDHAHHLHVDVKDEWVLKTPVWPMPNPRPTPQEELILLKIWNQDRDNERYKKTEKFFVEVHANGHTGMRVPNTSTLKQLQDDNPQIPIEQQNPDVMKKLVVTGTLPET